MVGGRKVTVAGWRNFQDHWRDDGWMNDGNAESLVQVTDVQPGTAEFERVLALAAQVLAQDRHLISSVPDVQESHVLGAFDGTRCTGFLRYLVQVIGAEAGRPRSCTTANR
jgi:predicted TPR repeat methyltransferase